MLSSHNKNGFSLLEMAVVLVVIGLITGMGISAGVDALESTRRVATQTKLDVIEDALFNFRTKYGRLPCPGSATLATTHASYGLEADNRTATTTCYTGGTILATHLTPVVAVPNAGPSEVPSGAVPARTLGLPDEFMVDGWGGKFHYEVTPAMTMDNAFFHQQPSDNCAITVNSHQGTALPTLPVYALVSYGKNGIGAYGKSGTPQTAGTAGTAEQTNIRTTTTTPTIRIKNAVSGAMNTTGYYDDIVRFKSLYQMMDKTQRETPLYKGPEMTLAYTTTSGTQITYGKKKCGRYQDFAGTPPAAFAANPIFAGFTPANTNFFVYHTGTCKFYSIVGTVMAAVTETTPVPNCPALGTVGAMAQSNGMLALNDTTGGALPYLRVYTLVSSAAAAKFAELPNALSPALTSAPENVSLSQNGEYLAVSKNGSYSKIYVKNGDYYVELTGGAPSSVGVYSNAIAPSGRYYASTVVSGGNTLLSVWRNVDGVYTQVGSAVTLTGITTPAILTFSPNSEYIAVGTAASTTLYVVNLNPATEVLTSSSAITLTTTPTSVAFSADSRFMAASLATTGSGSFGLYRRSGATTWTVDTSSNLTFGAASGKAIAFSR